MWRVGNKVPLNVYEGDRPVCQCHTVEDAARIAAAMNDRQFVAPDGVLVDSLDLTSRSYNCLKSAGLQTAAEVISFRRHNVLRIHNLGRISMADIEAELDEMGFSFSDPVEPDSKYARILAKEKARRTALKAVK